jgi:glycosyltransferase involved in cell wall biosynthesis
MLNTNLTVIMPNYNDAEYIVTAVEGVLNQRYPAQEIIIIDDGSTDNSVEIIRSLAIKFPQIKLLINEKNHGVCYSFNKALTHTTTDFVCFVSMDDANHPDWLAKSMLMLATFPQAAICCSNLYHEYRAENRLDPIKTVPFDTTHPVFISGRDYTHQIGAGYIPGTTAVLKTRALTELGGYREDLKWHSDWFAWHVIAMRYGCCYIPEPLVTLQVRMTSHSSVGIGNWEEQRKVLYNMYKTVNSKEFLDVLPNFIWGNLFAHFGRNIAKAYLENPDLWSATNYLMARTMLDADTISKLPSLVPTALPG